MSMWETIEIGGQSLKDTVVFRIAHPSAALPGTQIWLRFLKGIPPRGRDAARQQHEAAHALLWEGYASWMQQGSGRTEGREKAELLRLPSGKPYLSGCGVPEISISHTNGLAACAFSCHTIGVDVEQAGPFPEQVPDEVLSAAERRRMEESAEPDCLFFSYWTLKEAYGKACGKGIAYSLPDITFYPEETAAATGEGTQRIRVEAEREEADKYLFFQNKIQDYIISVCVLDI